MDIIKTYLTYQEYEELSLTSLTEDEFKKVVSKATLKFDILTDYYFCDTGIEYTAPSIRGRLKLVNGLLVEHEHKRLGIIEMGSELKVFKMGESSQTRFTPQELGMIDDSDYPFGVTDILRGMGYLRILSYRPVGVR